MYIFVGQEIHKNFMYIITAGKHKQNDNCHITVSTASSSASSLLRSLYIYKTYTQTHATVDIIAST